MSSLEFGKAAIRLSLLSGDIEKQLKSFEAKLEKFGKKFISVGKSFAIVGGAITAPFAAGLKAFTDYGGALGGIAKRTGFTVESLQALGQVAEENGSSLESVGLAAQGMDVLLRKASHGSAKAVQTMHDLGLSVKDFDGLSTAEKFLKFADAVSKVPDPLRQGTLAAAAFGDSGRELLGVLRKGAGGIREMMDETDKFGPKLSGDDVAAARSFKFALRGLWESTKLMSIQLGAAIVGPMTKFVNFVQPIAAAIGFWIKQNRTLVSWVAGVGVVLLGIGSILVSTGTLILFVGKAINICKLAVSGVTYAVKALSTAVVFLCRNPIVLLITVLAAVILYVLYATGVLGKLFHWIGKFLGITDDATESTENFNDALKKLKTPDIDLDKLQAGLDINVGATAKGGMDVAKDAQGLFDVSLVRQTIGDTAIQQQQLATQKRIEKGINRLQPGIAVI